jgi:hypothetical protein
VETMEATATPITEPAMPIFDDSRNDVTAAKAPASSCENDIPLKKFFTVLSMFRYGWRRVRHPRLIVFVFTAYTPRLEVSCHFAGKVSGRSQYCVSARAGPWL